MTKAGNGGLRFNQMGSNGPQRGGKHTNFEGGVDVPWMLRWPGHVPAGRTDEQSVISGVDWLPTLCAIARLKINASDFDGEDASAAWLGKSAHVRAKPLFWKTSGMCRAVRCRTSRGRGEVGVISHGLFRIRLRRAGGAVAPRAWRCAGARISDESSIHLRAMTSMNSPQITNALRCAALRRGTSRR